MKNFNQSLPDMDALQQIPILTLEDEDCGFQHQFSVRETYPFHTHTFYEFFLISKGKGIHRINDASILLSEGSFVFVRPQDRHGYDFLNQYDLELINISFQPPIFHKICGLLGCPRSFFTDSPLSLQTELTEPLLSDIRGKMLHIGNLEPGAGRKLYLSSVLPFFCTSSVPVLPCRRPALCRAGSRRSSGKWKSRKTLSKAFPACYPSPAFPRNT